MIRWNQCRWPAILAVAVVAGSTLPILAQKAASIEISPSTLTVDVGQTAQVSAVVKDASGNVIQGAQVLFFSGNRLMMGVTPGGLVRPFAAGTHQLTALSPAAPFEGEPDSYTGSREPGIRASISVHVPVPPLRLIRVEDLPGTIYSGTTMAVRVSGIDASGTHRPSVAARLQVSDGAVAETDGFGNLTGLEPGEITLTASAEDVSTSFPVKVLANPIQRIELKASQPEVRTGDVVHFSARALDGQGREVQQVPIGFTLRSLPDAGNADSVGAGAGAQILDDGRFVAEQPGIYTVVALSGTAVARASVRVSQRDVAREFEFLGQARTGNHRTSDLWVWEGGDGRDYAVVGSWNGQGHAYFFDVTDPRNMVLVDTVQVDARTVNDVKVSEDGRICVLSREGASNRRNGIVILDVSNPREVKTLSVYDDQLTGGVHNVFIYDEHVYAVNNGRRWDVINIEDPRKPARVGRFESDNPGRAVHDVWVKDGIAYHAGWTDGVIMVDVGGGGKGGSPARPVEMGRMPQLTGWTHAVWPFRSPSTGKFYVLGGDEASWPNPRITEETDDLATKLPTRMKGWVHFIEFDQPEHPAEVARYKVGDFGVHNYWIDQENQILYVGYYQGGLRALDISGELLGDLFAQGREIGFFYSDDPEGYVPNSPMVWGPQLYKGTVFFSDFHSGLWAVRLLPRTEETAGDGQ